MDIKVTDVALARCLDDVVGHAIHLLHGDPVLGVVVDLLSAGVPNLFFIEVGAHVFRKQRVRPVIFGALLHC